MKTVICPCCGTENTIDRGVCIKCKADLGVVKSIMDTSNLHYNRALTLTREARYQEAEIELNSALELYNKNPRYHNLLGTIYARQGCFDLAQEAWETAIHLDEETSSAYRALTRLHRLLPHSVRKPDSTPQPKRNYPFFWVVMLVFAVMVAQYSVLYGVMNEVRIQDDKRSNLSVDVDSIFDKLKALQNAKKEPKENASSNEAKELNEETGTDSSQPKEKKTKDKTTDG
jgi:tetratricopeptide (TPR) repeat protein